MKIYIKYTKKLINNMLKKSHFIDFKSLFLYNYIVVNNNYTIGGERDGLEY